jgi:hypothetical protein
MKNILIITIMITLFILINSCKKPKSYSKKIIGTWIGADENNQGINQNTDTLIFSEDSILNRKSRYNGNNYVEKYFIDNANYLNFSNGVKIKITFLSDNKLNYLEETLVGSVTYLFTKQN